MIKLKMKKIFLYLTLALITTLSCRKDEEQFIAEISIETQNTYDDQAAQKFLLTHYFDAKGNIMELKEGDTTKVKLSDLNPVILPSGVIYIVRTGAQPIPGEPIGQYDEIRIMQTTDTYIAADSEGKVAFYARSPFRTTIDGSGVPEVDPTYYSVLDANNSTLPAFARERKYYEIEGFQEALKFFRANNIPDDADYNLQGLIIIPSRAAFARDPHANLSSNLSLRNRSFIFNFQIYKATHFTTPR
jgi:hypothetical protein